MSSSRQNSYSFLWAPLSAAASCASTVSCARNPRLRRPSIRIASPLAYGSEDSCAPSRCAPLFLVILRDPTSPSSATRDSAMFTSDSCEMRSPRVCSLYFFNVAGFILPMASASSVSSDFIFVSSVFPVAPLLLNNVAPALLESQCSAPCGMQTKPLVTPRPAGIPRRSTAPPKPSAVRTSSPAWTASSRAGCGTAATCRGRACLGRAASRPFRT